MDSLTAKSGMHSASGKSPRKQKPRKKKWGIRWPWLFIPAALLVSIIAAMNLLLLIGSVASGHPSVIMGIVVIIFPALAGVIFNYSLGHKTPWRSLLKLLLSSIVLGIIAWAVNTYKS
ncbi:MAG: hypothetical protein AAF546_04745 [Verrucomicrobiota bacterium]